MHLTIWIEYHQKLSYIRNQKQRDFLTMYNRLEIYFAIMVNFICIKDKENKNHIFVTKTRNYDIFVAKIYD